MNPAEYAQPYQCDQYYNIQLFSDGMLWNGITGLFSY